MRTGPAGRQSPLSKEREKTEASQSTVIYERERGGSQSKRTRFTLTTPPSGIISENNYKIHYLVCGAKVARTGPAGRQSPLSKEREKTEASQSTVI